MSVIEIVQRFEAKIPKPVCAGCPEGRFEAQVEKWTIALAEQLAHETGSRWGVLRNSMTGAGLVEQLENVARIHPWFIVDHPGGGKTIEYSTQLVSERRATGGETHEAFSTGICWVIPTNHLHDQDRDRIAEILDRLSRIEAAQKDHDVKEHGRSHAAINMLQRLIILATHYGTTSQRLEWRFLGMTFSVTLHRLPEEMVPARPQQAPPA